MDGGDLQLPPGFRFHPTDEELVMHYLCRKCAALPLAVPIVAEVDLYKYDPWRLPGMALYGEKEWYFFSPRDRKYPNGSRPNRAAGSGYWKATGADKPIGGPKPLGIKKALVFYAGKAPRGEKTNWIMHEYRLANVDRSARKKNSSLRLDDWVLCRIYNKKGSAQAEKMDRKTAGSKKLPPGPADTDQKPVFSSSPHVSAHPAHGPVQGLAELVHFDPSDSMPRCPADSCSSEHVLSTEFTSEVESQPRSRGEWERALEGPINNGNASGLIPSQIELAGPCEPWFRDPLQDIFMYLGKPF